MVGHASEKPRRRRSEVEDSPRKEEVDEVDEVKVQEKVPEEPREPREPKESTSEVDTRLRKTIEDLEEKERSEETVSQRMERALEGIDEPEKAPRSNESRLKDAIGELEGADNDVESQVESTDPSDVHSESEHMPAVNDTGSESQEKEPASDDLSDGKVRVESHEKLEGEHSDVELQDNEGRSSGHDRSLESPSRINETESELHDSSAAVNTDSENDEGKIRLESMEEIDKALKQHPHVKNGLSSESYDTCERYVRVISAEEDVSSKDIAEREDLEEQVVESWREGVRPKGIHTIEDLETKRLEHEAMVPEEALEHRITPRDVREVTADALEKETLLVKELADIVHDIHQKIDNPELGSIRYAELYDSGKPLTEDRLRDIAVEIRANREAIQSELNTRLGLDIIPNHEVRIGVTDSRLYYWHVNTSPDEWVNVLEDQKFYMSKEDKAHLIDEMRTHLHIRGGGQTSEYYLNDLVNQISGLENPAANRIRKYDSVYSFDGEVMHIIADLQGKSLEDFKEVITYMGTKEAARVSNIQFPEIRKFRTRFVAIAESDCHLDEYGRLSYFETNKERMKIATEFYQEFGDFEVRIDPCDEKRLVLPRLYGAMAEKWGIPMGDKAIHNQGLHDTVKHARLEDKPFYPREMVPEDGCFSNGKFSVNRSNVLHPGKRLNRYRERYGIEPLVTSELVEFVRDYGTPLSEGIGYKKGERVGLPVSEIKRLIENEDKNISEKARSLNFVVNNNPNSLLIDEVNHVMKPLGIDLHPKPQMVYYHTKSERLSVKWSVSTSNIDQAIRWALVSPPDHPAKMKKVVDFVEKHPDATERMKQNVLDDGLRIHPDWREHGL